MRTALSKSVLSAAAISLMACGGGAAGGSGSTADGVAGPGGSKIKTAGGQAVSQEAHNHWTEALKLFKQYEQSGWDSAKCSDVADKFGDAADAQAKFAEAHYMSGLAYSRCGEGSKASAQYNKALGDNPKFCKARVALAVDVLDKGSESAAESDFARAVREDPQCTEGYVNLAIIQRRRGIQNNKDALANLRRALAIDAQYLPAFNEMALIYLSEAEDNDKKLDLAEVVCSQAQKINANYAPVYNTWGLIDLRRKKIIDASAKFQRAFELDGKMFEAYMNFAQITIGFRGYQDAKIAFEKALQLRPDSFDAQLGLGIAYRGLDDNAKAQEAYEKAIKLKSNRAEPYFNLGVIYQDFKGGAADDMKKARSYYEQFLSRAGKEKAYEAAAADIQRRCKEVKKKRGGGTGEKCVSGRLQNIELYLQAMKDMEEIERMQKEADKQAAAVAAENPAPAEAPAAPAEPASPDAAGK